jgi:CBS domain-containing protein
VTILDLCDRKTATVPLNATVKDAIEAMLGCHTGGAAILDGNGRVAGVFTERDVLVKVALSGSDPARTLVSELMAHPVRTAGADISPAEALAIMAEFHFRHLPIVDNKGQLLGMISMRNLLQWRTEDLSHELDALEQYFVNDSMGG